MLSLPLNVSYPTVRGQERSVVAVDILVVEITTLAFLFFPLFFLPVYLPYQIGLPPLYHRVCAREQKNKSASKIHWTPLFGELYQQGLLLQPSQYSKHNGIIGVNAGSHLVHPVTCPLWPWPLNWVMLGFCVAITTLI